MNAGYRFGGNLAVTPGNPARNQRSSADFYRLAFTSSSKRAGFQRLVLVTAVSRPSRRDSDWHRVIELRPVFETLVADEDGLYDPRDPNDRLVNGLKW